MAIEGAYNDFLNAMAFKGVRPLDAITFDGKIRRFRVEGDKKGTKNGWAVFYAEHPISGAFGSYKLGINDTWTVERPERMSQADRDALKRKMEDARRQREAEQVAIWEATKLAAAQIWAATEPADPNHAYIIRKGITPPPGLRMLKHDVRYEVRDDEKPRRTTKAGNLVIPIYGPDKTLWSVQTIAPDGTKYYLFGTNKQGHYWSVGKLTPRVIIAEGYATAVSIHMATGCCVVVAFDSGNLKPVAEAIRKKFPQAEIVIAADNDRFTTKPVNNPGVTYAKKAAAAVECACVWPTFPEGDPVSTDFNDMHATLGLDAVVAAFAAPLARRPIATEPDTIQVRADVGLPANSPPAPLRQLPDDAPLLWARAFVDDHYGHRDHPRLIRHQGQWLIWSEGIWRPAGDDEIKRAAYFWSERVTVEDQKGIPVMLVPNRAIVGDLLDATKAVAVIPDTTPQPGLLGPLDIDPAQALVMTNGILDLRHRRLMAPSPRYFVSGKSDVEFQAAPTEPVRWLNFLTQIWPDDAKAIEALQEWFGYCLTTDTALQKMLLIIGPRRSGKGSLARVLGELVGASSMAAPTFASLGTPFGLAPLIGKRVALIADARLSSKSDQATISERLLSITGEDIQTIDRKHLPAWTGKLLTRFMILTNEMPALRDSSGALVSRFIVLKMKHSFLGQEDLNLFDDLRKELPGILHWALDGLDRLRKTRRIQQPKSSRDLLDDLERQASPVGAFVADECEINAHSTITCEALFERWVEWCEREARRPGTLQTFARDLKSAATSVQTERVQERRQRGRRFTGIGLRPISYESGREGYASGLDVAAEWPR